MSVANKRWLFACLLVSFVAANFAFVHGVRVGIDNTKDNTDRVCTGWWFGGDANRLNEAKAFMCGRKR